MNPNVQFDGGGNLQGVMYSATAQPIVKKEKLMCANCDERGHSCVECRGPVDDTGCIAGCGHCNGDNLTEDCSGLMEMRIS